MYKGFHNAAIFSFVSCMYQLMQSREFIPLFGRKTNILIVAPPTNLIAIRPSPQVIMIQRNINTASSLFGTRRECEYARFKILSTTTYYTTNGIWLALSI
jgi:hypothetical protein